MKKKLLIMTSIFILAFAFTGCSKKKETNNKFNNLGEFIENFKEWNFTEDNFKNSDFDRDEDEEYNVTYSGNIKIGNQKLYCFYKFKDEKLNEIVLNFVQANQTDKEMISLSKWMIKQCNKYCNLSLQETTNKAIEDYVGTTYYFRINNDVDPMKTIEPNINDNVAGAIFSCLYKSKQGEFKDAELSVEQMGSDNDSTYIGLRFSNTKNEIQHFSTEAEESDY